MPDQDAVFRLKIDGREYTLSPDDLEIGEVELLEEELDAPLHEIDFGRAKAMKLVVYLLVHRDQPAFTLEDAAKVKFSAFSDPEADAPAAKKARPTKAAASGS